MRTYTIRIINTLILQSLMPLKERLYTYKKIMNIESN